MYPYLEYESMKTILFTDSSYKDFKFKISDSFIYFHYMVNDKPAVMDLLHASDFEENKIPSSLKDFPEAVKYLKSYFNNIAFT